jgi:hypothetical protein
MPGHGAFSDARAFERAEARAADPDPDVPTDPLPGATAKELSGPLALKAMRAIEHGLNILIKGTKDIDERVRMDAARWLVASAPKVAALVPPDAPTESTPEERDAALRVALESPEFCTLLVRVVASPEGAARAALLAAGWVAPE